MAGHRRHRCRADLPARPRDVGPVALSDRSVALIVKRHAERIGLDPEALAGHSLRSGGITAAAREGHSEREIARLSRHTDMAVLRGYVRRASRFEDAAQVLASRRDGS